MQILFRFIIGGLVVSLFAAVADALKPRSFAGLFAAAPSVAIGTLRVDDFERGEIIRGHRSTIDDLRRHCFVLVCNGGDAADDEVQTECCSSSVLSHRSVDNLRDGGLVRVVAMIANESSLRHFGFERYEMVCIRAVRFLFGGAITAITGMLANRYGPVFGGLFLAFPALFPASATLLRDARGREEKKSGNSKHQSRARGCCSGCARCSHRKYRPSWFRTYSVEANAYVERGDRAFRSTCRVGRDFGSDLAPAQTPPFSPQSSRWHCLARVCFVKSRVTNLFAEPLFCRLRYGAMLIVGESAATRAAAKKS